jgi:signal transduction histidine kinase
MVESDNPLVHYEALMDLPFPAAIITADHSLHWNNNRWAALSASESTVQDIITTALHSIRSTPDLDKQYSHLSGEIKANLTHPYEGVFISRLDDRAGAVSRYYLSLMDLPRMDDSFRRVWETMADIASEERIFSMYYWNLFKGPDGRPWFFASDYKPSCGFKIECPLDDLPAHVEFVNYPAYRAFMERFLETPGMGKQSIVAHAKTPLGRDRYFETIGSSISDNESLLASGIAIDVSAMVQAQQAQEQAAYLHAQRFALSGIVQEFNNRLTSWDAQLEFVGMEIPDEGGASARAELNRLAQDLQQGRTISRSLMRVAAFTCGRQSPREESAPEEALTKNAILRILEATQRVCKGIEFVPTAKLEHFSVREDIDEERLAGALINLALNARRAIEQRREIEDSLYVGRIGVKIEMHKGRPQDWTDDDADPCKHGCLQISVDDNGIGMSPEVLARCKDPFFTTDQENGHGMGLSETSALVTSVNGAIKVRSAEGVGTKVMIFLPARPAR